MFVLYFKKRIFQALFYEYSRHNRRKYIKNQRLSESSLHHDNAARFTPVFPAVSPPLSRIAFPNLPKNGRSPGTARTNNRFSDNLPAALKAADFCAAAKSN